MSAQSGDISSIDTQSFPYVVEKNVTINLQHSAGLIRCNVYRPKDDAKHPVLITYGPYGKDIPYKE